WRRAFSVRPVPPRAKVPGKGSFRGKQRTRRHAVEESLRLRGFPFFRQAEPFPHIPPSTRTQKAVFFLLNSSPLASKYRHAAQCFQLPPQQAPHAHPDRSGGSLFSSSRSSGCAATQRRDPSASVVFLLFAVRG